MPHRISVKTTSSDRPDTRRPSEADMKLLVVVLALLAVATAEDKTVPEDSQAAASTAKNDKVEKRGTSKNTAVPTSNTPDGSQYTYSQAQQFLQQQQQQQQYVPQANQFLLQQSYSVPQQPQQQYQQQQHHLAPSQQQLQTADVSYLQHAKYQPATQQLLQPQQYLLPQAYLQPQQLYSLPSPHAQQQAYYLQPQQPYYIMMLLPPGPHLGAGSQLLAYIPPEQLARSLYHPAALGSQQQQLTYLVQPQQVAKSPAAAHVKG